MYTGDLVLRGFGESGGYVGSRTPKAASLKLKAIKKEANAEGGEVRREEGRKNNAEFTENAECAEKSRFLLSECWYLLS